MLPSADAGKFFRQNLIENIVLVVGNGLVDAAFGIGFGRNIDTVPLFHQNVHFVFTAKGKDLGFQIVIGLEPIISTGGIENPITDIYHIQQKPEFFIGQIDLHGDPPCASIRPIITEEIRISRWKL